MRAIPSTLDPRVVARIDERLDAIESDHGVTVALAIESGSRAWGFPSPDSDYDCRFLYLRPESDYLTPWLPRDVIETPLDHVYDVKAWDVRKAVALMVRGNATVTEWLRSPIVYRGMPAVRDLMLDLAARITEPALVSRHDAHLGRLQWDRLGADTYEDAPVRLKGVFYCVRPAAALRWLRLHPEGAVLPMTLPGLLTESDAPADVVHAVDDLIALKSVTKEIGTGSIPPVLRRFVRDELLDLDLSRLPPRRLPVHRARELAAEAFRAALHVSRIRA